MSLIRNLDELTITICKSRNKELRRHYAIHLEYLREILFDYNLLLNMFSIPEEQGTTNWDTTWRSK